MLAWDELVLLPEERLAELDVAEVHLACAVGLRAGPSLAVIRECLDKLDAWTAQVKRFTDLSREQFFTPDPAKYKNSEALFCSSTLVAALQRHCGMRYNAAKIPIEAEFDAADSFIHGAILGDGGTCASIAVVVAAVGRRLGYPLKLVCTRRGGYGHVFGRWDEPGGERLNVEATAPDLGMPSDNHYRTGLYRMTGKVERMGLYLRSLTPRWELAHFMAERAWHCCLAKNWREYADAAAWACVLSPGNLAYREPLKNALNHWWEELTRLKPPGFPQLDLDMSNRRYPGLEEKHQQNLLAMEAMHLVLTDADAEKNYWGPMRRREFLYVTPSRLDARYANGKCGVRMYYETKLSPS